jgi:hypothetical protein
MAAIEILVEKILNMFNNEVLLLLNNVHKKYPETSLVEMENIWHQQKFDSPYDELGMTKEEDNNQCQHMYIKGKNANTQCKTKVKRNGNYCSKHARKHIELEKQQTDSSETESEKQTNDCEI